MQIDAPRVATDFSTKAVSPSFDKASTYWALCGVLLVIASVPLLIGVYPPFIDYPFHLARISMLADWNGFVREHYEIPSILLPNLSLEMVMLPLSKIMPAEYAGVTFIIITFALLLFGTAVLHQTLFGTRSLWPLVAAGWLYNWIVFYGFMNYVFGVGMMLLCLAASLQMAERQWWLRLIAGIGLALLLFFCHLVAFILYAFAIAGFELQRFFETWRRKRWASVLNLIIGAAQFIPALIVYVAISPTRSTTTRAFLYDFPGKFASLLVTFTSGNKIVDLMTIALFVAAAYIALRRTKLEFSHRFVGAFIGLAVAFLLAPRAVQHPGPAYVDIRVPIALLFTAIAATRVTFSSLTLARGAAWSFGGFLLIKVAMLSIAAADHKQLMQRYLTAYDELQPQSTLFAARQRLDDTWFRRFYVDRLASPHHAYAYAVIRRNVFVPAIYTVPGGQPIRVRDKFQALKAAQGDEPVEVRDASDLTRVIAQFVTLQRETAPGKAAYLLIQDRAVPIPLPTSIQVVATGPGFRLAKIVSSE
jgi:hypothetical protein